MDHPKLIVFVKFKSPLNLDEVTAVAKDRADEFRALSGLIQKYYVQDAVSGEFGGVYLWESPEAFDEYRQSELRASIGTAYQTIGEPRVEVLKVIMPLRDAV
ncbi:YdhR family protein [Microbaculum marinisediminis]|uniref:YdhR family protein n=1 Tax=Microbaculum marinisediminis TaxID=2931392 RepID=A0AAW5QVK6_9HYPH|nr:YdhR family protein [Microbaculum sp. A6E488]MCT8970949.1 YdhR family protein [Microbaculum sp. A6E488]